MFYAAGGTGAVHQIDGIVRKEHLKTSARVLEEVGHKWVLKMGSGPQTKSMFRSGHLKVLISFLWNIYGQIWKGVKDKPGRSVRKNGPQFIPFKGKTTKY